MIIATIAFLIPLLVIVGAVVKLGTATTDKEFNICVACILIAFPIWVMALVYALVTFMTK